MGLESATFISQLVNTNPVGTDDRSTADDHMRLIKAVLQSTFTNATAAITATPTEFNILAGAVVTTAELNRLQSYVGTINRALISDASGNIVVSPGVTTTELNILDGALITTAELNALQSFVGTINRAVVTDASGNLVVSLVTTTELNKLDGLTASTVELNLTDGLLASTAELNTMDGILSTTAELNRLQSFVGTPSRAIVTDGSGNLIVSSTVTSAELAFINSVTSNVQTQINGKAPTAHSHTGAEISALDTSDITTGVAFPASFIPTHTGEVTGQTSLLLADSAITGQADIASAIVATDELLISNGGTLQRTDVSRITTFLNPVIAPEGGGLNLQTEIATTSGGSHEFTSIPSWVTRLTMTFDGVSNNSASQRMFIEIGDSGGYETSGYSGSAGEIFGNVTDSTASTANFGLLASTAAVHAWSGRVVLNLNDTNNSWSMSSVLSTQTSTDIVQTASSSKSLTGTLDRIRLKITSGVWDAGAINLIWE